MEPLVSIIVPIYKVEEYLDKCVLSLLGQSYSNLEIILVDDGSPDQCGAMCDSWALRDSRIRVIHKENGGLSDARNAGLAVATGAYICFVDSDDWVSPEYVMAMYQAMVENGAQLAACDVCEVYPDQEPEVNGSGELRVCTPEEAIGDILKGKGFRAVAWNKLYPRAFWENETYPVGKHHEDEFVTYRILGKAQKLVYVDKAHYFYLQRQGSIMRSFTLKRLDALDAFLERLEYFRQHFPAIYRRDKAIFCTACVTMYCHAQRTGGKDMVPIRKKIRHCRRQIHFTLKELKGYPARDLAMILGSGRCIGLFCAIQNMRNRGK